MPDNILMRLKANLDFLTNTEKKIADIILYDPQKFTSYALAELSSFAGVSQGSIINFSKKYADGGFPALKLSIARSLHTHDTPLSTADFCNSPKEALQRSINSCTQAFELTASLNQNETLKRVADLIFNARKVEIYGIYRSAVIATDLYYQLLPLGIPVSFVSDILTCALSASMLDPGDLVIAVSSSGKTQEIINAVKNAKSRNVPVVSLTSNPESPLGKLSDEILVAAANDSSVSGRLSEIRLSQMILADTLCSYILSMMDDSNRGRYLELSSVLKTYSVED